MALQVGISQASVSKILKANKFHSYHLTLVQDLRDYSKQAQSCNFMRQK
jgi:hypothetical protein